MGFVMYCNNKGCGKTNEPLLDKNSNEVYCTECGNVMSNIPEITKKTLVNLGQIKRHAGPKRAFTLTCESCAKAEQPTVKDGKIICKLCQHEFKNITPGYAHALKQFITSSK